MDATSVAIIVAMGLVSYALRLAPQVLLVGWKFPASVERYLRYLAYALVVSIISTSLFISAGSFAGAAAPRRSLALAVAIAVAALTRSVLAGMLTGTVMALVLSWWVG
jgi:branched-subunit amino acid transport protein